MMKKLLFVCIHTMLFAKLSFANSGTAVVPTFYADTTYGYAIHLSNISAETITVYIRYYDRDGNLIQDGDDSTSTGVMRGQYIDNFDDNPAGASISFTLLSNESGYALWLPSSSGMHGYATVEWQQDSTALKGLVAVGQQNSIKEHHSINAGLPF